MSFTPQQSDTTYRVMYCRGSPIKPCACCGVQLEHESSHYVKRIALLSILISWSTVVDQVETISYNDSFVIKHNISLSLLIIITTLLASVLRIDSVLRTLWIQNLSELCIKARLRDLQAFGLGRLPRRSEAWSRGIYSHDKSCIPPRSRRDESSDCS